MSNRCEGDAPPPHIFFASGRKDKSKHAGRTNKEQGGDRTQRGTTLLFGREVLQDCVSFPRKVKKIACLLSDQGVMAW